MQKLLITLGIVLLVAGLLWPWLVKLPIGRLPGDLLIERPGMKVYIPLTTMIVISIIVSILLWFFRR